MPKAIAVAAVRKDPFRAAVESAHNSLLMVLDFMYGTPERVNATYIFATVLCIWGFILSQTHGLAYCSNDTLI